MPKKMCPPSIVDKVKDWPLDNVLAAFTMVQTELAPLTGGAVKVKSLIQLRAATASLTPVDRKSALLSWLDPKMQHALSHHSAESQYATPQVAYKHAQFFQGVRYRRPNMRNLRNAPEELMNDYAEEYEYQDDPNLIYLEE